MTAIDPDDDFARFRAERLAKRPVPRQAPGSAIPFFGTDRKTRIHIRNKQGDESLESLLDEAFEDPAGDAPKTTTPAPGARTARRAPVAGAGRAPLKSPPRGAPRRAAAKGDPGAGAPLAGAPGERTPQRACPPTAVERPRRRGVVPNPPLPPRRTVRLEKEQVEEPAAAESRPAPGSRDRRAELPDGAAEPMEQVVQATRREAERAQRKFRFRKENSPEDLAPEEPQRGKRVYRQYSTSRRLRRAAARDRNAQGS